MSSLESNPCAECLSLEQFQEILGIRAKLTEAYLDQYPAMLAAQGREIPQSLRQAILYSLKAGGKRLRPALCLASAALCGLESEKALPFASAIEMIHSYSLIHDDLPAMDDDDLRRGKPSNHKVFGEATAILAGDGVLTDAFALACESPVPPKPLLESIQELALAAGSGGMVGGQELDMLYTRKPGIGLDELAQMQAMKTGALIRASCVCGARLAGVTEAVRKDLSDYGRALGAAYQIADDILDQIADSATLGKPAGSDLAAGKTTYAALLGIEASRELALAEVARAKSALAGFVGQEAAFLRSMADYVLKRAF